VEQCGLDSSAPGQDACEHGNEPSDSIKAPRKILLSGFEDVKFSDGF
jgi:hypothetical protein